jgi:hypothetical protein
MLFQSAQRICTSDKSIRIREAQKHADPADPDPDPQHGLAATKFSENLVERSHSEELKS